MYSDNSSQNSDGQTDQAADSLQGQHVLLAEDCVHQGRLYLKFLQMAGAEVTLECNGKSAVETISKAPEVFDAVVMDFQMPVMDGLKATKQLREFGFTGTILAVTSFGSADLRESWLQAGCDEYLEKPLKKKDLIAAVIRNAKGVQKAVL